MNIWKNYGIFVARLFSVVAAALLLRPATAAPAVTEQKFDLLQIGTQTYTNVTVTTKAKTYIFLMHSAGMANVKVADLSPEVKEKLGYAVAENTKAPSNNVPAWAQQTMARMDTPQVKEAQKKLGEQWRSFFPTGRPTMDSINNTVAISILAALFLIYLFYCYCSMLICRKAGKNPGIMVWLPILQQFPLLRAADMSCWWFLAFFVPVLNIVMPIMWCFKIAKARGKSAWVGFFLLLPIANLFAYLYLAFADSEDADDEPQRVNVMTLETT